MKQSVSVEQLLMIIGQKQVEIEVLRAQVDQLNALLNQPAQEEAKPEEE